MSSFKSYSEMSEKEFLEKELPQDHNDQDIIYLKLWHKWQTAKTNRAEAFAKAFEAYNGTTFQKNNKTK